MTNNFDGGLQAMEPTDKNSVKRNGVLNESVGATSIYCIIIELFIQFLSLLLPAAIVIKAFLSGNYVILAFTLVCSFYLYSIFILFLAAAAIRLIPKPEKRRVGTPSDLFRFALLSSIRYFVSYRSPARGLVNGFPFGWLYYKIAGSAIHPSAHFFMAEILDPYGVTIGENSMIGRGTAISCHYMPGVHTITFGEVKIGRNVLVGVNSFIWPDVVIEDNAVVGAYSMVKPGTVIKQHEVWAGIPAKKIEIIEPKVRRE